MYKKTKSSEEKSDWMHNWRSYLYCIHGISLSYEVASKRVGSRLLIDDVSAKKREHSRKFEWRELAR